jgi:N-acetylglucosaminyl-diphospho-decaprenol L-rhamnosyltransferase
VTSLNPTKTLGVVVVTHHSSQVIEACLGSLETEASIGLRVVIVDNASADDTVDRARQAWPEAVAFRNDVNLGFAAACNQGLEAVGDVPYVVFLNPDTEAAPGAFSALIDVLVKRPDVGAVGPKTIETDGTIQLSFGPDLTPLAERRQQQRMRDLRRRDPVALAALEAETATWFEPDWLSGSCLMVRTAAVRQLGGFDERFFLYEEDADLCLRLRRAGFRLAFVPEAHVTHHGGRSVAHAPEFARLAYHQAHLRYYAKHNSLIASLALRVHLLLRGLRERSPQLRRLALGGPLPRA